MNTIEKTVTFTSDKQITKIRFLSSSELFSAAESPAQCYVFDTHTRPLFEGSFAHAVVLNAGEENKTWDSIDRILSTAVEAEMGRDSHFIGVGGGVVGDLTGFAASVYMRGARLILVPTTLLAMVDASIGGKTGFDFKGYKNMAGSYLPAEEVRICLDVLRHLPEREFHCGLAEVIKHALLADETLLTKLEQYIPAVLDRDPGLLPELVERAIQVKIDIVEQDFTEAGVRAYLNLGHTFAHALETATGFSGWSHGEAVAWGIDKALKTGVRLGITDSGYAERVEHLLKQYGFQLQTEITAAELMPLMRKDKKKREGQLRYVLQKAQGETIVIPVDSEVIRAVLSARV